METLLKKYFWLIQLAMIALIALLAGLTLTNTIGAGISPLLVSAPPAPAPTRAEGAQDPNARRLSSLDTAVWKPEPVAPKPEEPTTAEPEPEPEPVPEYAEGEYPVSSIDITLTGTTVATSSVWSMALFNDKKNNATLILQEKEYLTETAEIVRIERDRVVIRNNGQLEQIDLEATGAPPGAKNPNTPFSRKPPIGTTGTPTPPTTAKPITSTTPKTNDRFADIRKGISKVNDSEYTVDRNVLSQVLTQPDKFKDGTQVKPNYNGGKINGFKLSGLPSSSPLNDIGIRSGDVITAINGTKLDSPNKALELYQKMGNLGGLSNVTVTVERGGKSQNLTYRLK